MKTFKPPRPFVPRLTPAELDKKIVRRIHLPSEAEFARGLYSPDPQDPDTLVYSATLDKKGVKRLKKLAKAVRRNRGFVSWGKVAVLGVIVAGTVLFYVVFKNALLSGYLTGQLESLFGAKAEVAGLDFDPIGGKLTWSLIEVADKNKPMTNLFQLGRANVALDTWQLVNGHVDLRDVTLPEVQFGTPRKTSGALARPTSAVAAAGSSAPAIKTTDFVNVNDFDATALVKEQLDKLKSVPLALALKNDVTNWGDLSRQANDEVKKQIGGLESQIQDRIRENVSSIRSVDDVKAALAKTVNVQSAIAVVQKQGTSARDDMNAKIALYQQRLTALRAAAADDTRYLQGLADHPQALGNELASKSLGQVLGPQARRLQAQWARLAPVLAALHAQKKPKPAPGHRIDRVVVFPTGVHPAFFLRHLSASVVLGSGNTAALLVQNVNSDPDRAGAPATFSVKTTPAAVNLEGQYDGRTGAATPLQVTFSWSPIPLSWESDQPWLGLKEFKGTASLHGAYSGTVDGQGTLSADGVVSGLKLRPAGGAFIGEVTSRAVASLGNQVKGHVDVTFAPDQDPQVNASTNLDAAFVQGLRRIQDEALRSLNQQITKAVNEKLTETLGPEGAKVVQAALEDNGSQMKSLDGWKQQIDQRVEQLRNLQKTMESGAKTIDNVKKGLKSLRLP